MAVSSRTTRRAGFTLVELMVALVAGSFAVMAVYYLSGVSSRGYQEQMRVAETQLSLRSAMEQLRRDISRAGYLATPNSSTLAPDCEGQRVGSSDVAPRRVRALDVTHNGSSEANATVKLLLGLTDGVNQTRADILRLWGNYATGDAYLTDPRITTSSVIEFQIGSESFRRSFFPPAAGNGIATLDKPRFEQVFRPGRMLRIEQEGRFFFRDIQDVDTTAAAPQVILSQPLPYCFDPTRWTAVAPVMRVRYQVEPDNAAELDRISLVPQVAERAASPRLPGTRRTLLVRREETDGDGSVVAQTSRVVLDYAVEFAVDAVVNSAAYDADPPVWDYFTGNNVSAQATANPEKFGSLIVTLSSRSTDADPNLRHFARANPRTNLLDPPLLTFRVVDPDYSDLVLRSRVRTMRSEIFLQNQ